MLKHLQKIKNNYEEGFTLTELIVVIVIIGILATIAVPMYLNNRKQAIDAQTESNVKSMASTADRFFYENPKSETLQTNIEDEMRINGEEGNRPLIFANADAKGYCVMAWNESGGKYKDFNTALTFDSSAGGLNQWSDGCNKAVPNIPNNETHPCHAILGLTPYDQVGYQYAYSYNNLNVHSIAFNDGSYTTGIRYASDSNGYVDESNLGVNLKMEVFKDGTLIDSKESLGTNVISIDVFSVEFFNNALSGNGLEIHVYENDSLVLNTNYKAPSDLLSNTDYCTAFGSN